MNAVDGPIRSEMPFEYNMKAIPSGAVAREISAIEAIWRGESDEFIRDILGENTLPGRMKELKLLKENGYNYVVDDLGQILIDDFGNMFLHVQH